MSRLISLSRIVVLLVVLASLAVAGGRASWHLMGESADHSAEVALPAQAIVRAAELDLSSVAALAPFGSKIVSDGQVVPIEETELDLVLRGVVLNDVADLSYAFIAVDGITRVYRPGETVIDDVVLLEVAATMVTIEVEGARQTLSFPNSQVAAMTPEASDELSPFDRMRALITNAEARPEVEEIVPETTEDYINLWRERIISNPSDVLRDIGLTASENGYIINEEHDVGVRLAGLRPGDVVSSVNGQAVGDVEQDSKRYDDIAASGVARLEIIRDGKTITMSFPLK